MNSNIVLKFSTTEKSDRLSFDFQDDTGQYSVSNPGGMGSPNPTSAQAVEARIKVAPKGYATFVLFTITLVSGVATSFTVTDVNGNASAPVTISKAFPFLSSDPFNITGEQLGFGVDAKIIDNVYPITYEVDFSTPDEINETVTQYEAMTGNIECCLDETFSKVNPNCSCDDLCALAKSVTMLESVQKSIDCGRPSDAQLMIDYLADECDKKNCGCK